METTLAPQEPTPIFDQLRAERIAEAQQARPKPITEDRAEGLPWLRFFRG